MRALMALLFALALVGCAEPSLLKGSGQEVGAPWGYQKLCIDHPDLETCPKVRMSP